jgi:recombination protein U
MAKSVGKFFEADFKNSIPENVYHYRLKDGTAGFAGQKNENVRFQATNDFDFFVHADTKLFGLELKSVADKRLPFSNIKKNQWEGLHKISLYKNCYGYFLVNFRSVEKTYAIEISDMMFFRDNTTKKSINVDDCNKIGKLIPQKKKVSRYTYNLEKFLKGE